MLTITCNRWTADFQGCKWREPEFWEGSTVPNTNAFAAIIELGSPHETLNGQHSMSNRRSIKQIIERFLRSLPPIEPFVLIVLAVCAASLWGFIKTADAVFENETQAFDRWMLAALRDPANPADPIGPAWLEEIARDVSALGGFTWITFATVVIAIYLWIDDKTRMALFLVAAAASGAFVSLILKSFFARPRPDLVPHLSQVFTSSFPSGHSMSRPSCTLRWDRSWPQ